MGAKDNIQLQEKLINELGLYDIPIIAIAKGNLEIVEMKHFSLKIKLLNLVEMILSYSFYKDYEMRLIDLPVSAHRDKRIKGMKKSLLDQIGGIGKIRKKTLLNHFGSARAVESASLDELKSIEWNRIIHRKKNTQFFPQLVL
jgi:excinuclease ABC subunit C